MNDSVNGLIAKLWLIGRSYAASPERRNYAKEYLKNSILDCNDEKAKPELATGSNGTDSFFMSLSKNIVSSTEYSDLKKKILELSNKKYVFDFDRDEDLLKKSIEVVLLFNKIIRKCVEQFDEKALINYEKKTNKAPEDRNLRFFLSFSSKFIHFHLPDLVFIIDSFSFAHASKRNNRKKEFDCIFCDENNEIIFSLPYLDIHHLNINGYNNNKEKNYIKHVTKCYAIMCKMRTIYNTKITPRMVDNFIMQVNKNSKTPEIE